MSLLFSMFSGCSLSIVVQNGASGPRGRKYTREVYCRYINSSSLNSTHSKWYFPGEVHFTVGHRGSPWTGGQYFVHHPFSLSSVVLSLGQS